MPVDRKPPRVTREARDLSQLRRDELLDLLVDLSAENDQLRDAAGEVATDRLTDDLRVERDRVRRIRRRRTVARNVAVALVAVAAVASILATMFFPVLRIFGSSMQPTLHEGDYAICTRTSDFRTGDLVAFYYNNKLLVKRVIATGGQQVLVTPEGAVYVDGAQLSEPYVSELALGDCDLEFPYQVPEGRLFVMGDHRATSTDSRNSQVGCVGEEAMVGRLIAIAWPPQRMGVVTRLS